MALRTMSTHSIPFYRKSQTFLDGEFVTGAPTLLGNVEGSLQPFIQGSRYGEVVKLLPEGYDSQSTYLFFTTVTLRAYSLAELHKSDYCQLPDGTYSVMQAANWQIPSFQKTSHNIYMLIKSPTIQRGVAEI